jgi:hypothetical protein
MPKVYITNFPGPPYPKDVMKTPIDISLQLLFDYFGGHLCLAAIQQNTFYTGIKDLNFHFQADIIASPDIFQSGKGSFCLLNSSIHVSQGATVP